MRFSIKFVNVKVFSSTATLGEASYTRSERLVNLFNDDQVRNFLDSKTKMVKDNQCVSLIHHSLLMTSTAVLAIIRSSALEHMFS
jgi:hypothetical protein